MKWGRSSSDRLLNVLARDWGYLASERHGHCRGWAGGKHLDCDACRAAEGDQLPPADSPHCLSRKQQIKIHDGAKTDDVPLGKSHFHNPFFLTHSSTASHAFGIKSLF